jgi:hypothetical protein
MNRPATILLLGFALSGCSIEKHIHGAQLKVAHFHALLNAGNADQIVAEAGPGFSWPSRGPSFRDYLLSVHRKLGFCGSWRMLNYHEDIGVGGLVRISADTHCDADNAQESFVFTSGDLRLRSYAVTSRILVTG